MALPNYGGSNPGTVSPTSPTATLSDGSKPGSALPIPKPGLNTPVTGGSTGLQQNAQSGLPVTPNNGNPNGVFNVPRPRRFNTRFGGGQIGGTPQEGAVLGQNGVRFGRGALTENQIAHNESLPPGGGMGVGYDPGRIFAHMQSLLSGPISQPNPNAGLPVSQPNNMGQQFANQQAPVATTKPYPLPMNPSVPISPDSGSNVPSLAPRPPQQVSPYPQAPIGAPTLNSQGYNTNTYYGGQNPNLGRYRPPQMIPGGGWADNGGYNYNLPNAYGPYPKYQTGPYGYGNGYG
jgi:hypothetical protein